jgi:energy-coupling factor transport system ATP-binding protein
MIEAKELCYQYPESVTDFALRGVSFSLKIGEWVVLMGANGSGKTTFVRCLNGLIQPLSGEVFIDGISTKMNHMLYEIRRRVGMVFQNPDNQIVTTTVEREVAFGLENLGIAHDEMKERVEKTLRRFHLENYRNTPPHLLSGGERQRLALASVWVMEPNYLILDEPTSLLDPQGRSEIFRYIEELMEKRRIGVLLITQYPEDALMFERLIVMREGRIVLDGPPRNLFQNAQEMHRMGLGVPVEVELSQYTSLKNGNSG